MITVVIPTVGRPSLSATLAALGLSSDRPGGGSPPGGRVAEVIVVDDRRGPAEPLDLPDGVRVLRSGGRGPAAARNVGWRAAGTPWVAFLDDDVVPEPGWTGALAADLAGLPPDVAGSQGRVEVPLPQRERLTDAERATAGLADAAWITADMAYRRSVLDRAGGFDERFPRAYREDADLALRVLGRGHRLVKGRRVVRHPVRDDGFWASVRRQRGNEDDALMRRVHGPGWRAAIGASGRLRGHAATTLAAVAALALSPALVAGRGPAGRMLGAGAVLAGGLWAGATAGFAWRRIAPGPRTGGEIGRMAVTSVFIPPLACAWRLRGEIRSRA
ncbi:hypothetical protein Misp01_79980 [Microtetraspora sp. NBRC 13810]|uniref:glycosyltransferase family 2 protein n=1 Tax=Microtetraspora sp. NBRC 13810 TaxID=3030990 RepID=UPI0024A58ECF|nr:glycosyltransferase [Microtetraspora sp. NBRC 13810]GLW12870.1 hypothetical protein Misp01_79980 [Microtetraspora sp. NBRC 13810]